MFILIIKLKLKLFTINVFQEIKCVYYLNFMKPSLINPLNFFFSHKIKAFKCCENFIYYFNYAY